jgi:predicted DNA-binding protein (UPF0251 family)
MPRPHRIRRVDASLEARVFKPAWVPLSRLERRPIALDGLEALRLADLEGLYHEEAARRMGVSRATFGRVLAEARRAVAGALVEGTALAVEGGPVDRRAAGRWPCPIHGQGPRRGRGCRCRRRAGRPRAGRGRQGDSDERDD